jgi:uncharacterized protein
MPHQCVRCGKLYQDGEIDIMTGCPCGARMFYFIRPEKYIQLKEAEEKKAALKPDQREQMEEDVYDLLGNEIDRDKPVILDMESIEVTEPGKYTLDIVKLFQKDQPFIIKLEDGKYYVDLVENFERLAAKGKGRKKAKKK